MRIFLLRGPISGLCGSKYGCTAPVLNLTSSRSLRNLHTFCARAASRVNSALDQVEDNDDERMSAIAKLAYKRGEYGYALFQD